MSNETLPAITLWQPYATLIAVGAKRFETRSWAAPSRLIGQRIAIHAAARKLTSAEFSLLDPDVTKALGSRLWETDIPYGAVVCTALLKNSWRVTARNGAGAWLDGHRAIPDDGFGDYTPGRFCWELTDVRPLDPPASAKGRQGWWKWKHAAPSGESVLERIERSDLLALPGPERT